MSILINQDNFQAIKLSPYIAQLSKPLELLGITFFNCIRIYKNKSRISLSNNPDWLQHFYKQEYYKQGMYSQQPFDFVNQKVSLWKTSAVDGIKADAAQNFNIDNGITLIKSQPQHIDFYLFASTRDNDNINEFYLNHLDLLEHYVTYYQEKSQSLLKQCKPDIWLDDKQDKHLLKPEIPTTNSRNIVDSFYAQTEITKYHIQHNGKEIVLSKRQHQCLELLLQGYPIKGIAATLKLSPRTCQHYIETIKDKFECSSMYELIALLQKI